MKVVYNELVLSENTDLSNLLDKLEGSYHLSEDYGIFPILECHSSDYIDFIKKEQKYSDFLCFPHYKLINSNSCYSFSFTGMDTGKLKWDVAYNSIQTILTGLSLLMKDRETVFCLTIPGHFSSYDLTGFNNYLNNAIICAVNIKKKEPFRKVFIIDIGTNNACGTMELGKKYDIPTFSINKKDSFPYYYDEGDYVYEDESSIIPLLSKILSKSSTFDYLIVSIAFNLENKDLYEIIFKYIKEINIPTLYCVEEIN